MTEVLLFVGVSTGQSAIHRLFPGWADALGLDLAVRGVDLPTDSPRERFRRLVEQMAADPAVVGAVITSHKVRIYEAAHDLLVRAGADAALLGEVNTLARTQDGLRGNAVDATASGQCLDVMLDPDHWGRGGHLLVLGAGGSSLALTLAVHQRASTGRAAPSSVVVTDTDPRALAAMADVHARMGMRLPVQYIAATAPGANDRALDDLPPHSLVVNATGAGKDWPGSPLGAGAAFPADAVAWDFNYRGDLGFLAQARRQVGDRSVHDGRDYFVRGWAAALADILGIAMDEPLVAMLGSLSTGAGTVEP